MEVEERDPGDARPPADTRLLARLASALAEL